MADDDVRYVRCRKWNRMLISSAYRFYIVLFLNLKMTLAPVTRTMKEQTKDQAICVDSRYLRELCVDEVYS